MRQRLARIRDWFAGLIPSLRLRLVVVFALVALSAAVAASGIAYWLTRDAVVNRAQSAALKDFHKTLGDHAGTLPPRPKCEQLQDAADAMAHSTQNYEVVLLDRQRDGQRCPSRYRRQWARNARKRTARRRRTTSTGSE